MCFCHIYIGKYFKHKFPIKYFFSAHAYGYHANLGEHGCLGEKLAYTMPRDYIDLPQ